MKKLLILLLIPSINISAQVNNLKYSDDIKFHRFHSRAQNNFQHYNSTPPLYIIPVVVHILHEYGPENISDWQVKDAINILNKDFRKLNADTVNIVPSFIPIAADCEIEFRLASIDPNGNCTNGIEHIFTPLTNSADNHSKLNHWPNNKYLNIWVVHSLINPTAYGYSTFSGGPDSLDGIVIIHDYMGSIGTASANSLRSLTALAGRYLNLPFPWGDTNIPNGCGDDSIADTPETTPSAGCNLTASSCNPPIIENVQNFMTYNLCSNMFTQGQKARMHSTLNSSVGGRSNLWTMTNLIATGTNNTSPNICQPYADFISTNYTCAGSPVTFTDLSWNAQITNWSWSFPGGNPSFSTDSNPTVTYTAAGVYDATLTVTSAGGTDTKTQTAIVHITDTALNTMPYSENFESPSSFPGNDGWIENTDSSNVCLWIRTNAANTTPGGSHCIKIDNFNNINSEIDSWITPSIDFTNVNAPVFLSFQVANAQRSPTSNDELKIFYSIDCGQSWQNTFYSKSGSSLATAGIVSSDFTPSGISDWRQETFTCNAVKNKPNVRFKFQNESDHGNNIYIDDINITGNMIGIDESDELQNGFSISPNPSSTFSTIQFGLNKNADVILTVKNLLGQNILQILNEKIPAGVHEYNIPKMKAGIYFVDVEINGKHFVRKLICD